MTPFQQYKRQALERAFSHLNPEQRRAAFSVRGPLLILAGAGSGKTTVLIQRIAYLLQYGNAYHDETERALSADDLDFLRRCAEEGIPDGETDRLRTLIAADAPPAWQVMAITFTNKAANELRERLEKAVPDSDSVLAATFHSACVRMLRRDAERLGYSRNFTIYDSDDSQRVIKQIAGELSLEESVFPPRQLKNAISAAKNGNISAAEYAEDAGTDYFRKTVAAVYAIYEKRLREASAVDFDDILLLTVRLLKENPDVLEYYHRRYRYILVDEYQDTNMVQFELVSLLAGESANLCVVGDDDQSIYKFRGATIENILGFEKCFPGAEVIRLEQNYRSTGNILACANAVIAHNRGRKGKTLWTDRGDGEKITVHECTDEQGEGEYIARTIRDAVKKGAKYSDMAVLYRINAASNMIERGLVRQGVPYRVFGGLRFYDRKEIKDMLAYLSLIHNPADDLRLLRIINEPKRGIGDTTLAAVRQLAEETGESMLDIICRCDEFAALSRRCEALKNFAALITGLRDELSEGVPLSQVYVHLTERSGYRAMLENSRDISDQTRLENIDELLSNIRKYESTDPDASLDGFLEDAALMTDMDNYDETADTVVLMTIHGAKGLEFDTVFVAACEENIFPGRQSMMAEAEIEEERRLAYVAFTRARRKLIVTHAQTRLLYGSTTRNPLSRFAADIPPQIASVERVPAVSGGYGGGSRSFTLQSSDIKRSGAVPNRAPGFYRPSTPSAQTFSPGMRVRHAKFGDGTVLSAASMGADTLLEIAFDGCGTRKLMARYAGLKIL